MSTNAQFKPNNVNDVIKRARDAMAAHGPLSMTAQGYIQEFFIMKEAEQIAKGKSPHSGLDRTVELASNATGIPKDAIAAFADFAVAFYSDALPPAYYEHFKKHGSIGV
jgi:hypothetical protein